MTVCQKLGVILESKVVQKLSLEKKVFTAQVWPLDFEKNKNAFTSSAKSQVWKIGVKKIVECLDRKPFCKPTCLE